MGHLGGGLRLLVRISFLRNFDDFRPVFILRNRERESVG
jgi:hypothetical protein